MGDRIEEYDDGYDSKTSFERADEDRPEDMDPEEQFEEDWGRAFGFYGLDPSFQYSEEDREHYVKAYREDTIRIEADRAAAARFLQICSRVRQYNAALNRLEIPPNGDDYNALLDLVAGGPLVLPKEGGR